jgi:crossover junction endodeoxyribonuclease RuvC
MRYSSKSWRAFRPDATDGAIGAPLQRQRILGLDPGSRRTGYGLIDCEARSERHVASGCIDVSRETLVVRLQRIHQAIVALVQHHRPDIVAIERVFMHRNPESALKLGQARGVALCASACAGAAVFEYAPRAIKLAVTGYGAAAKPQVAHMVARLLQLSQEPQADAADALAAALCHAQSRRLGVLLPMEPSGAQDASPALATS